MDFTNLEKFSIKVHQSHFVTTLLGKPALMFLTREQDFTFMYHRLGGIPAGEPSAGRINDVRVPGLVQWKTPPIGCINSSSVQGVLSLVRDPSRQYKLGLTRDNTRVIDQSDKRALPISAIYEDEYTNNLILGNYPSIDEAVEMMNKGYRSVAVSKTAFLYKHHFGVVVLSVGGYPVAWFDGASHKIIGSLTEPLINLSLNPMSVEEISRGVRNVV